LLPERQLFLRRIRNGKELFGHDVHPYIGALRGQDGGGEQFVRSAEIKTAFGAAVFFFE
jgi:hypothetical protein